MCTRFIDFLCLPLLPAANLKLLNGLTPDRHYALNVSEYILRKIAHFPLANIFARIFAKFIGYKNQPILDQKGLKIDNADIVL